MDDQDDQGCSCRNGQRPVTEVWARQEAGIPRDADLASLEARARDAAEVRAIAHQHLGELHGDGTPKYPLPPADDLALIEQMAKYRAALNTVFPCPSCRPAQFARWRHGCYRPNHVAKRCRMCKDSAK